MPAIPSSRLVFIGAFGIALPCAALFFELISGGCANLLFDPIPTWAHIVLVAFTPLANALVLWRSMQPKGACPPWLIVINIISVIISGVYALAFAPVTHMALIGVIIGIGLLPLAPLGSLISALLLTRRLFQWRRQSGTVDSNWMMARPILTGLALAVAMWGVAEGPRIATVVGVSMVESVDADTRQRGMSLLRTFGSRDVLLRACLRERGRTFMTLDEPGLSIATEEARRLFYRVTGETFGQYQQKENISLNFNRAGRSGPDRDLGGEQVGQLVEDVVLASSRLDGVLYPESATGYVEWTMVFRNHHEWEPQEARFILQPPTGGVVSRVTLWINGEPREAAFGKTAIVREAYQEVAVRQRRDPLLVTSIGFDEVLAQCFPILPGDEMKIRIGMSFPLEPNADGQQFARLPQILDENFLYDEALQHSLWYEAAGGLRLLNPELARGVQTAFDHDFRVSLGEADYARTAGVETKGPTSESRFAYSPLEKQAYQVETQSHAAGEDVFVVVNGSRQLRAYVEQVADWLRGRRHATVWLAGDEYVRFEGSGEEAAAWLQDQRMVGGQDNVPALGAAISAAMDARRGADQSVWWFDVGQPVLLSDADQLMRWYERGDPGVSVIYCPLGPAVNRLRESPPLAFAPTAHGKDFAWQSMKMSPSANSEAKSVGPGAEHRYRVALASELRGDLEERFREQAKLKPSVYQSQIDAIAMRAANAQIVTPLTGAVVLENQAQYDRHDLNPADPDTVPNVPEPAHAALVVGSLGALAIFWIKRKRKRRAMAS